MLPARRKAVTHRRSAVSREGVDNELQIHVTGVRDGSDGTAARSGRPSSSSTGWFRESEELRSTLSRARSPSIGLRLTRARSVWRKSQSLPHDQRGKPQGLHRASALGHRLSSRELDPVRWPFPQSPVASVVAGMAVRVNIVAAWLRFCVRRCVWAG